jgi:tRNA uridine 5-carboxymethylaminomethyl modification enzyme
VEPLRNAVTADVLLSRPNVYYQQLQTALELPDAPEPVIEQVEMAAKYGSYIERQQREVERVRKMERRRIPPNLNYAEVKGLRNEARHVLERFRPATLGQAGRLAGINPADVAILLFTLERQDNDRPAADAPPNASTDTELVTTEDQ